MIYTSLCETIHRHTTHHTAHSWHTLDYLAITNIELRSKHLFISNFHFIFRSSARSNYSLLDDCPIAYMNHNNIDVNCRLAWNRNRIRGKINKNGKCDGKKIGSIIPFFISVSGRMRECADKLCATTMAAVAGCGRDDGNEHIRFRNREISGKCWVRVGVWVYLFAMWSGSRSELD